MMMKINQNVSYDVKQGASLTTGKILYDRATKFRALGFFMFFWFFHSHHSFFTAPIVLMNVKNFMQPNLTKIRQIETIFDPLNALK